MRAHKTGPAGFPRRIRTATSGLLPRSPARGVPRASGKPKRRHGAYAAAKTLAGFPRAPLLVTVGLVPYRRRTSRLRRQGTRPQGSSLREDSNLQPPAYEADALPLSYGGRLEVRGFEPRSGDTLGLGFYKLSPCFPSRARRSHGQDRLGPSLPEFSPSSPEARSDGQPATSTPHRTRGQSPVGRPTLSVQRVGGNGCIVGTYCFAAYFRSSRPAPLATSPGYPRRIQPPPDVAGRGGFEPPLAGPEPAGLPVSRPPSYRKQETKRKDEHKPTRAHL